MQLVAPYLFFSPDPSVPPYIAIKHTSSVKYDVQLPLIGCSGGQEEEERY
ncbi:hypothetical protein KIPB_015758, partial [Kipferlia bialata]|eukprot:g15758.t1